MRGRNTQYRIQDAFIMKTKHSLRFIVSIAVLLFMQGCHPGFSTSPAPPSPRANASLSNVEFAKSTFTAMADGDASVAHDIDWDSLKASSTDVGAMYRPYTSEAERNAFTSSFIKSYSQSFKKTGADVRTLTNWKLDRQDATSAAVSAETQFHTHLRLSLTKKNGTRLLNGIEIEA
jgi:hypothetical protein